VVKRLLAPAWRDRLHARHHAARYSASPADFLRRATPAATCECGNGTPCPARRRSISGSTDSGHSRD
jgi:hypothetical protein